MMDTEKDSLKKKINAIEEKYKQSETKKNYQVFTFEQEKARWQLEKDILVTAKRELKDKCDKLQHGKE